MSDIERKYEHPSFHFDDHSLNKAREERGKREGEELDPTDQLERKGSIYRNFVCTSSSLICDIFSLAVRLWPLETKPKHFLKSIFGNKIILPFRKLPWTTSAQHAVARSQPFSEGRVWGRGSFFFYA